MDTNQVEEVKKFPRFHKVAQTLSGNYIVLILALDNEECDYVRPTGERVLQFGDYAAFLNYAHWSNGK